MINRGVKPCEVAAVNPHWSWLCGYSQSEAVGKTPTTLLHGGGTDQAKAQAFAKTLESANTASVTLVNYTGLEPHLCTEFMQPRWSNPVRFGS